MMRDFAGFRLGAATVLLAAPAAVQAAPAVAAAPVARPVAGISLDGLAVAEVLRLPWGSAAGSLGRRVPDEGNPECPSTLAADARGRVWILDQVNARVQVFVPGARRPQVIPLPADTFQDLAPDGRGGVAVLDRLVSRTISFVSASGQVERTLSVEGPGIPEGGGVTALFRHDDGWWLEYDHARVVRVAGSDGSPDTLRPALLGRLSPDGSRLFVASVAGGAVTLGVRDGRSPPGPERSFARVVFDVPRGARPLVTLLALEPDARGRVWLAAAVAAQAPRPSEALLQDDVEVRLLGPDGAVAGRARLPAPEGPEEMLRPVRLGEDGALYQLACEAAGAVVRRVSR